MENDLKKEIEFLKRSLKELSDNYYSNNFSASQDFNKFSRFNTRLKIPHYGTLPTTCVVGEIAESSGKLYICSVINTWTVAGTQT